MELKIDFEKLSKSIERAKELEKEEQIKKDNVKKLLKKAQRR